MNMKKFLTIAMACALAGCVIPKTPDAVDLRDGARQFRPELFDTGSRGQVILSMSDNLSGDGFFDMSYTNIIEFENIQSNEKFSLRVDSEGEPLYDTAMLPIGRYRVSDLMLQYITTSNSYVGNTRVTTTEVNQIKGFIDGRKVEFDVKPKEVVYIGHFYLIKGENKVTKDGAQMLNRLAISDNSKDIPAGKKAEWKDEFGKSFNVRIAKDAK